MNELARQTSRFPAPPESFDRGARLRATPLTASLLLAACASTTPSPETGVAEVELPEAQHAEPTPAASVEPRARPLRGGPGTGFSLGALATPPIGSACVPSQDESQVETCGTVERISMQLLFGQPHASMPEDPPCAPQTMKTSGIYLVSACIAEEHLYLREVCIACRMPDVGSTVYARLDELTPKQHAHLGRLFHTEQATPTRAAEWKRFVATMTTTEGPPLP
jgi:hypothetical protein